MWSTTSSPSESGLDYFGARHFSGSMGRFASPDKLNVTDDRLMVPSTLNKYAYAANNPLRFEDLDGRAAVALLEPPGLIMPGHFMLFAYNPANGQSAMISFGPADQSAGTRAIQVLDGPVSSTATFAWPVSADDLRRNYAALSIQTSPDQAQGVINLVNQFSATDHLYRLYQTNCTTVCGDALRQNTTNAQVVDFYGGAGGAVYQGYAGLNQGPAGWNVVAVADFDGNGTPDLVWQNASNTHLVLHYYGPG